ncbi:sirohydrochlorin ferrochelatase [Saccharomonospora amisosensis]|uniref:Sirohydrochlorin ferrochelatase n=1 Tax=Saccharomonospora amisosensis TaxID=1128677 RepID=A0A7X5US80_9PSEU|nr:sirohydrochlorin chelatase [Saccharomonospora amisosensis]NIJ13247.1 sirohydrochlorin ferrochelatase [Saccharomonospora amisosensis]
MAEADSPPALLAVAHGSRDPRSAATVRALVTAVRLAAPGTEVREAFLDLSSPKVGERLAELHARGQRQVVVVPLLLGSAYHARVDLPALIATVTRRLPLLRVSVADVLSADPLLESVALDRLTATGAELADPELGIVLAAVGSSHVSANAAVSRLARRWHRAHACAVAPAFASATLPDVPSALARLRARGARHFAVASWFLAPGLLPDRVNSLASQVAPGTALAAPLGADPRVARVVLDRYRAALAALRQPGGLSNESDVCMSR